MSENKLMQFNSMSCLRPKLVRTSAMHLWLCLIESSRVWPNYSNNLKPLLFSICWWYNHRVIYALYEISTRLLKYFFYNQHIGCFKGQVRRQSFLHNYKCGNAYSNSQALLLGKLPVIVPQSNPAVTVHSFLICTHINVMIKYWPINYNLKMSSV